MSAISTLAQSALLAGLVQAPGRLDPFHPPEAARARRDEVLARMLRAKLIDEPARAAAAAQPIALHRPHPSYGARVPWYTEQVRQLIAAAIPERASRAAASSIRTAALPGARRRRAGARRSRTPPRGSSRTRARSRYA